MRVKQKKVLKLMSMRVSHILGRGREIQYTSICPADFDMSCIIDVRRVTVRRYILSMFMTAASNNSQMAKLFRSKVSHKVLISLVN